MRAGLAVCLLVVVIGSASGMRAAQEPAAGSLDYEFFKTKVQPIFLAKRPGHARCIACHGSGTPLRLQPLAAGQHDLDRRGVAQELRRGPARRRARQRARAGSSSIRSTKQAGGDFYHNGGKHWSSQNDPEWQTLKSGCSDRRK